MACRSAFAVFRMLSSCHGFLNVVAEFPDSSGVVRTGRSSFEGAHGPSRNATTRSERESCADVAVVFARVKVGLILSKE